MKHTAALVSDRAHSTPPKSVRCSKLIRRQVGTFLPGGSQGKSVLKLFKSVGLLDRFARFKNGEPLETLLAEAKA